MIKCTKNGNEKCTTRVDRICYIPFLKGGVAGDFLGGIYGRKGHGPQGYQ